MPLSVPVGSTRARQTGRMSVPDRSGLFSRDDVAWRLHASVAMLPAGLRALLLQVWHPSIAAAVAHHSHVAEDPWGRLEATTNFIDTVTYRSRERALAAIARVRSVHDGVTGETSSGVAYAASNPALLGYVHATLVDSALRAAAVYGPRLSDEERDRYANEMANVAELLDVPDPPRDAASVSRAVEEAREVGPTREGRDLAWLLLLPPMPLWLRPAYGLLTAAAVDLLPRRCAVDLGLLPVWPPARPFVRSATGTMLSAVNAMSRSALASNVWTRIVG
jgi:uncharacterized protein (DUF2236 family)